MGVTRASAALAYPNLSANLPPQAIHKGEGICRSRFALICQNQDLQDSPRAVFVPAKAYPIAYWRGFSVVAKSASRAKVKS